MVSHKVHLNLSIDQGAAIWGLENIKPSLSAGVENWLRIKRKSMTKEGQAQMIKSKSGVIDRMAEEMLSYLKEGKEDSPIEKQMKTMAQGLQFILQSDFGTDITIEEAKKLLMKKLKEKGYNG